MQILSDRGCGLCYRGTRSEEAEHVKVVAERINQLAVLSWGYIDVSVGP